jgi:hypothetical protein
VLARIVVAVVVVGGTDSTKFNAVVFGIDKVSIVVDDDDNETKL